ncbi:hypothetical protein GQ42DRAFT_143639 [Ramicandelaber brevisporus]|nr:hypothetical protein GQ42DRAFT_143639 [Ramicandelaber brevisporus]
MTPKLDAADVAETVTERQKIVLDEKDLIETFIRGSGNGGQKINKTSICVDLRHIPTGIRITCHDTRSLQANRAIARKRLKDKLDQMVNGDQSKAAQKIQKIQQQKNTQRKRALKKYGDMSQGGVERYKKNRPSEQQQEQQQEQ